MPQVTRSLATVGPDWVQSLTVHGFTVVNEVLSPSQVSSLIDSLAAVDRSSVRRREGETYAIRDLFRACPGIAALARGPEVHQLVAPVLGAEAFPVRGILFDKVPEANWSVGWHQDRTIGVKRRVDVPGFEGWSEKEGIPHVQPPAELMARLLTVRIHLDPCDASNGALRVIPGSHRTGRLSPEERHRWLRDTPAVTCSSPAGAALLMRPLLLHASSPGSSPAHRRVIHLDFAAEQLPDGLQWDAVEPA